MSFKNSEKSPIYLFLLKKFHYLNVCNLSKLRNGKKGQFITPMLHELWEIHYHMRGGGHFVPELYLSLENAADIPPGWNNLIMNKYFGL